MSEHLAGNGRRRRGDARVRSQALKPPWAVVALAITENTTLVGGGPTCACSSLSRTSWVVETTGSSIERRDAPTRTPPPSRLSPINERRQTLLAGGRRYEGSPSQASYPAGK
jgi:hypothetical protein